MKKNAFLSKIAAVAVAIGFGLLITFNSISGDEFFRGVWEAPETDDYPWADLADLNPNHVIDYEFWGYDGLEEYLDSAGVHDIDVILRLSGPGNPAWNPYAMWYYAHSQYNIYEAEIVYGSYNDPEFFYHFLHSTDPEDSIGQRVQIQQGSETYWVWYCDKENDDTSGVMLFGPMETIKGIDVLGGYWAQTTWPDGADSLQFISIVRVMANVSQLASPSDPVFTLKIMKNLSVGDTTVIVDTTLTGADLADLSWTNVEIEYWVKADQERTNYMMIWQGNCDFWVDWIKYMDKERGYWLWHTDSSGNFTYQDSILNVIKTQCREAENNPYYQGKLVGYLMSDEPRRSAFRSHFPINQMALDSLQLPTTTPMNYSAYYRKPEVFTVLANPHEIHIDKYPFRGDSAYGLPGSQNELDTLCYYLEESYQIAKNKNLNFHVTLQAHKRYRWISDSTGFLHYRNPTRSEILAESFIALAHGADKLSFFTYASKPDIADTLWGLSGPDYNHSDPKYYSKWQAVHDVFTQLDSIGDILLSLERDTAFCVYDGEPNPPFVSPITGVEFAEEDTNYIEVGQFHDANDANYLILVNRRTDADRHINVATNLTGSNALLDLYTREQFLSSTGEFKGIPFDSGEGRVFKIVEGFSDWIWTDDDRILLTDTVYNTSQAPNTL